MLKKAQLVSFSVGGAYAASLLVVAVFSAWVVLAKANFLYAFWHEHTSIGAGIARYAPENQYKRGFEGTTLQQRDALFRQINHAVHNHGKGLGDIRYHSPTSGGLQRLLREPEVVHLQDVANLLETMKRAVAIAFVLFVGLCVFSIQKFRRLPAFSMMLGGLSIFIVSVLAVLFVYGPKDVFNQLHVWIFPGDHQWFFFYQESLMSTMMFAPVLFGWIALALSVLGGAFFLLYHGILQFFTSKWVSKGTDAPPEG